VLKQIALSVNGIKPLQALRKQFQGHG